MDASEPSLPLTPSIEVPFKLTKHLIDTAFHLLSRLFSEGQCKNLRKGDGIVGK